jgi:hypothetical protein
MLPGNRPGKPPPVVETSSPVAPVGSTGSVDDTGCSTAATRFAEFLAA